MQTNSYSSRTGTIGIPPELCSMRAIIFVLISLSNSFYNFFFKAYHNGHGLQNFEISFSSRNNFNLNLLKRPTSSENTLRNFDFHKSSITFFVLIWLTA